MSKNEKNVFRFSRRGGYLGVYEHFCPLRVAYLGVYEHLSPLRVIILGIRENMLTPGGWFLGVYALKKAAPETSDVNPFFQGKPFLSEKTERNRSVFSVPMSFFSVFDVGCPPLIFSAQI